MSDPRPVADRPPPASSRSTAPVPDEPAAVLAAPRWVAPLFCGLAVVLVPWTVLLAETLPQRTVSRHWDVAWVGFDIGLLVALGLTGWCAWRRTPWLVPAATAAATLLCVDAWFDVVTAPAGGQFYEALVEAVAIELPLAALSLWTAGHAERVFERLLRARERRVGRRSAGSPPGV